MSLDMDELVVDPLDRAVYLTVHDYVSPTSGKKGALGLGPVIGMPAGTLQNKANPMVEPQGLTVKEARQVMLASGDHRILHQLALDVGEACMPLPTFDVVGDLDVLEALTEWQAEVGQTAQQVRDIYEDKVVKISEVEKLRRELVEDFEKGMALLERVKAQAQPD